MPVFLAPNAIDLSAVTPGVDFRGCHRRRPLVRFCSWSVSTDLDPSCILIDRRDSGRRDGYVRRKERGRRKGSRFAMRYRIRQDKTREKSLGRTTFTQIPVQVWREDPLYYNGPPRPGLLPTPSGQHSPLMDHLQTPGTETAPNPTVREPHANRKFGPAFVDRPIRWESSSPSCQVKITVRSSHSPPKRTIMAKYSTYPSLPGVRQIIAIRAELVRFLKSNETFVYRGNGKTSYRYSWLLTTHIKNFTGIKNAHVFCKGTLNFKTK
ncbi:unnamed protein product [Nesidiocoris tenuis]|uniref:Uncharacterized protein n=1 Tax=Nesidiocoris tenuis TaxID=355587 RepID=A0A6H5FXK8_9HEMI|nr:unnamed protein product [Nesidiocoris tenuis]